jgi:hypothetical protein
MNHIAPELWSAGFRKNVSFIPPVFSYFVKVVNIMDCMLLYIVRTCQYFKARTSFGYDIFFKIL